MPRRIGVVLLLAIAFLGASAIPAWAQEFEPRIQRNWRLAFMFAYPIRPNQGFVLSIGTGGNFGAGTDFDTVSLGYQFSWGDPTKQ